MRVRDCQEELGRLAVLQQAEQWAAWVPFWVVEEVWFCAWLERKWSKKIDIPTETDKVQLEPSSRTRRFWGMTRVLGK